MQGEVEGEVEQLRDNRTCAWREDGMTDSRNLNQVECDVSVRMTRQPKQRAGVLRPRACWCTSCHCCHCPHWSSRCCTCGQVVLRSHFVRDLLYLPIFSLHPPSVTVDCVDCYRYNHDKFCIKFLLRFMPQMNS